LLENPDRFGAAMDPKTSLQELAARHAAPPPQYVVTDTGPDHNKTFHATVTVDGVVTATGEGTSKKNAEMAAALQAWTLASARDGHARASRG
jgi:ribonuclease-3